MPGAAQQAKGQDVRELAILEAPSVFGLRPSGVQGLPAALLDAGLLVDPATVRAGRVEAPAWQPEADTGILTPAGIAQYSLRLDGRGRQRPGRTRPVAPWTPDAFP